MSVNVSNRNEILETLYEGLFVENKNNDLVERRVDLLCVSPLDCLCQKLTDTKASPPFSPSLPYLINRFRGALYSSIKNAECY